MNLNPIIKNNDTNNIVKLLKYNNLLNNINILKKGGGYLPMPIFNQIPSNIEIALNNKDYLKAIELFSILLVNMQRELDDLTTEINKLK